MVLYSQDGILITWFSDHVPNFSQSQLFSLEITHIPNSDIFFSLFCDAALILSPLWVSVILSIKLYNSSLPLLDHNLFMESIACILSSFSWRIWRILFKRHIFLFYCVSKAGWRGEGAYLPRSGERENVTGPRAAISEGCGWGQSWKDYGR